MRCISSCYPPSILSMVTHGKAKPKPKQYFNSVESFQPSKISWLLQWQNPGYGSFTTRATTPATLFLAATSPPNSGDFPVLFKTSAVMLVMYLIANFVVPDLVMKGFQAEEAKKKDAEEDQLNELGSTPRRTAGSGKRKKGSRRRRE